MNATASLLEHIFSEPMTASQAAGYFDCHRNTATKILQSMEQRGAAKRFGGLWQIRASELPVPYWIKHGMHFDAPTCNAVREADRNA